MSKITNDDNFSIFGAKKQSDAFFNINKKNNFNQIYLNRLIIN